MPDDQSDETTEQPVEAAATQAPSYITREELQSQSDVLMARIEGLVAGIAQRQPQATAPQAPSVSLADINEAISRGEGGAEKIAEYVAAQVESRIGAMRRDEIDPLRTVGLSNLEQLAKASALAGLPNAKRYASEIDGYVRQLDDRTRGSIDAWKKAYELVVGAHHEELQREAVEKAVRQASERQVESAPGGSAMTVFQDDDGSALPTLEEMGGAEGLRTLRDKGIRNVDELAQKMGYKDGREYLKVAKMVENYQGDLI